MLVPAHACACTSVQMPHFYATTVSVVHVKKANRSLTPGLRGQSISMLTGDINMALHITTVTPVTSELLEICLQQV